jgi:hypothetical protein
MAIVMGILSCLVGAILAAQSARIRARANPSVPLPVWTTPPNRPVRANLLQGAAGGLMVLGTVLIIQVVGYAGLLVMLPFWLPAILVMLRHNRLVAASRSRSAG